MDIKDYFSLTMSVAALGVSFFSLIWTNFWNRIAFHYVQTGPWGFALVNGGKTDILIREIRFWFVGNNANAGTAPPQDTGVSTDAAVLLKAGTAAEHSVQWIHDYPWEHIEEQGRPTEVAGHPGFEFTVTIEIGWIDVKANLHTTYVNAGNVIRNRQKFLSWTPKTRKQDLAKPTARKFEP